MANMIRVPKTDEQHLLAYVLGESQNIIDRLYMGKVNSKNVLVSQHYLRGLRSNNKTATDKLNFDSMLYYATTNSWDYFKDVKWVIVKVKPPRHEGVYTFQILESEDDSRKGMRKIISNFNKLINRNDSFYCLGMLGTRIQRATWYKEASVEEPHHKTMRRILKQPSIWRSYPNLYAKAKSKIPYFETSGEVLDPQVVLIEQSLPNISFGIPKDIPYTSVSLSYTIFRPTFDSPNVKYWGENGYRLVA